MATTPSRGTKCPVCESAMTERNGKFGLFYVCDAHGTLSVQNGRVWSTGGIYKALRRKRQPLEVRTTCVEQYYGDPPADLELLVRAKMANMGVWATELDLFVEGGQGIADTEPDHWMNLRPY